MADGLTVTVPAGGFARASAIAAIERAGLAAVMTRLAPGPFGATSCGLGILEALVEALDVGLAAAAGLKGLVLGEAMQASSFSLPSLTPPQAQLVGAFQLVVTADALARRLDALCGEAVVAGMLELDGLDELLAGGADPAGLAARAVGLAGRYVDIKGGPREGVAADAATGRTLNAFFELLRRGVVSYADQAAIRPIVEALAERRVTVAGYRYDGLQVRAAGGDPSGLIDIWPNDIVGNVGYLEAGLRLARDVAGYDFDRGKNPKRLNPVLFGLGRPGCGKTVTAHAIGNYFLKFCRERDVPARFVVVRRTDWASSYQNASAANLVRIFSEQVYGFAGVAGVYWPDIDTAFASRDDTGLRMEEKQNLGAVFGVFDGTLLPKDGKWFLICDANTMHMDEATISRIAQNPFTVAGPTTAGHYVTLMRDLMLRDVTAFVPSDEASWDAIGAEAAAAGISGRGVEAVCGNIRAAIQDFEYPDAYYAADPAGRDAILAELSRPMDAAAILETLREWLAFHREAEERDAEARFESDVEAMVRQLNAGRAAAEKLALESGPSGGHGA